jgi:3-oxoacyl-[acyl-carrier protein] reductase
MTSWSKPSCPRAPFRQRRSDDEFALFRQRRGDDEFALFRQRRGDEVDLGLKDRSAIVTGGAAGIGAAVVLRLAEEGCSVAIVDCRPAEETAALLDRIRALGVEARHYQADVRDLKEAQRIFRAVRQDVGRLDILVCSAGVTDDGVTWRMTEEQWDTVMGVNLKGCFNYNREAALVFKEQKGGWIVNIASINGLRGKFGQSNYAASKGGMIAFSKSLARELGKFGVNVNVVAPGMVRTEMTESLPPDICANAVKETALGRLGTPEDCADLVAFLCSTRARNITGTVSQIDGGQYM